MPTLNENSPKVTGSEMFYYDEAGKRQDSGVHDEILAGGEDGLDTGEFDRLVEELGLTDAFAEALEEGERQGARTQGDD